MKQKRAVILDFDGTLADTAPLIINVYNTMAKNRGWRIIGKKDFSKLRHGGIRDAMAWAGIRFWQFPRLIMDGRKLFKLETEYVKLFPGMKEMIDYLLKEGYGVYVLSRNTEEIINRVLRKYEVSPEVVVLKSTSFFGGKHKTILNLVNKERYNKNKVWMVGDETRDIEAAKKAGVNSIGVTWGLQHKYVLARHNPTALVDKSADIKQFLKVTYDKGE